jgi:tol-pal system protein YbgF
MPFGIRTTACVISCLALSGCASHDLMVKRQAEAEAKIEHLLQTEKQNSQRLNELSGQLQMLGERLRDSSAQISQLRASIGEIRAQGEPATLGAQEAPHKIEVVNPDPTSRGRESGPPAEYVKAFGLYSANNFSAAIQAFQAFLQNSPKSDYTPNAIYWIGECHYTLSDFPRASAAFQKVVETYPRSAKAPDAMLKLGYSQAAMRERDKATRTFESLIRQYPSSPAATRARERLTAH